MAKSAKDQPIVLMYHGIISAASIIPEQRDIGAELYDVTAAQFRLQMQWLKDNGYAIVTLDEPANGHNLHKIILTFDDGEINNFKEALPILREFQFSAYFFVIAKKVGKPGYMGWEEIKKLDEGGMIVGSHGFSHEILTNLRDTQVEEELNASKRYIERNLGIPVDSFSIPRGFCNDKIIRMAYAAGYKHIFVSEKPNGIPEDCLGRIAVKSNWTLQRFGRAFNGSVPFSEKIFNSCKDTVKRIMGETGYDWLRQNLLRYK